MPASSMAASTASSAGWLLWMSVRTAIRMRFDGAGAPERAVYRRAVPGRSSPTWLRLGATAVAAVVVAEAAAWLLRTREIEQPVSADEHAYFSSEELAKASDYASGQRLILVGSLVAEGAVLVLLATGRPGVSRRAPERVRARAVAGRGPGDPRPL